MATMNKHSRSISKIKPKIRIIHIFAPEIIRTDTANFRDLVQRLTGKPSNQKATTVKPRGRTSTTSTSRHHHHHHHNNNVAKQERVKMTMMSKEELGMWNADTSGGFLTDFAHLQGYDVHELVEFPHLPLDLDDSSSPSCSSRSHDLTNS